MLAAILRDFGVGKGDRVIIYMPMVPEAVFAMLACARIGAVHSVVFGGFAASELATRIDDAKPKLILSASCGLEPGRLVHYKPLLDEAIELASHKPQACLILQRPQARGRAGRGPRSRLGRRCATRPSSTPSRFATACRSPRPIRSTSSTPRARPASPKGVVRDNGGHMVALKWSMQNFYGIEPGEVFWAASDVGWVVGHSYIVYAPLLHGCTTILYEGKPVGTPDAGAFWRVIAEHGVVALFTAPTAFRAIKKEDPQGKLIAQIRSLEIPHAVPRRRARRSRHGDLGREPAEGAGDRSLVADRDRLGDRRQSGRARHRCRSSTARRRCRCRATTCASSTRAAASSRRNQMGSIVIKLPLPPACLPTLWQQDERFRESYLTEFPGYYKTADAGFKDEDGYLYVMGRTDDIINVAGHRLSTGGMEEVLAAHRDVAECAVIGITDALKGEVPCGFVVLKAGVNRPPDEIEQEIVALVREKIGPVAAFKLAITVARLPKTRSGKILRGTMKKIADGEAWTMPATIDDPGDPRRDRRRVEKAKASERLDRGGFVVSE